MNIQEEICKIHFRYGVSEMATYKIQLLFDSEIENIKKEHREIFLKITGFDQPYNLISILSDLVFATEYLLHVKNYDGHNYEKLNQLVNKAKETIQFLETKEAHLFLK